MTRQIQLSPEADPILDLLAHSHGDDPGVALSELLIAHEAIESFFDEFEDENAQELLRQRDRSELEFERGLAVPWDQVKLENGL